MRSHRIQSLSICLLFADFLSINFSFVVTGVLLHLTSFYNLLAASLVQELAVFNIAWLTGAGLCKLYNHNFLDNTEETFRQSYKTVFIQISLFSLYSLCSSQQLYTVKALVVCYGIMASLLLTSRFVLTFIVNFVIKRANLHKKIAIVGYNDTAKKLATYFQGNKNIYSFEGFFDNPELGTSQVDATGEIVGPIAECIDYAIQNNVKEIYSTIMPHQHGEVSKLVDIAENNCVRVKFISAQNETAFFGTPYQPLEYVDSLPVMGLRVEPLNLLKNRVKKRLADIIVSLLVIIFILSWLIPILAIIIKLSSKGPIFFRQLRSGRDNENFWCFKFRSMTVNAGSDKQQATKNDARVTKIGAFMRKTSIDELPQFFNVLAGHMSICGPRPHMLLHTSMYGSSISKYMVRHLVKPGITGWAQVNGYRGETTDWRMMEKRVEFDLWYLENWSSMLDVKIVFLTVLNAIRGEKNAY